MQFFLGVPMKKCPTCGKPIIGYGKWHKGCFEHLIATGAAPLGDDIDHPPFWLGPDYDTSDLRFAVGELTETIEEVVSWYDRMEAQNRIVIGSGAVGHFGGGRMTVRSSQRGTTCAPSRSPSATPPSASPSVYARSERNPPSRSKTHDEEGHPTTSSPRQPPTRRSEHHERQYRDRRAQELQRRRDRGAVQSRPCRRRPRLVRRERCGVHGHRRESTSHAPRCRDERWGSDLRPRRAPGRGDPVDGTRR